MRDTAHLSLAEHGAYTLLLDVYYATELPIPGEMQQLHRLCRATTAEEQAAVASVADQFFPMNGDGRRHNGRADRQIPKDRAFIDKQTANAQRPRKPDASQTLAKPQPEISQTLAKTQPNASPPTPTPTPTPTPSSGSNEPSLKPKTSAGVAPKGAQPVATDGKLGPLIWSAYSEAYGRRYAVDPVRNAKVNGQLAQLGKRLGAEAPDVARWYVASNVGMYVRSSHCVDLLLRDAEGLRTEWATGRHVTQTQARQADRKQSNFSIAQTLLAEGRGDGH